MALIPTDLKHKAQILAGTIGRKKGHSFEKQLSADLNVIDINELQSGATLPSTHIVTGNPAKLLLKFILQKKKLKKIKRIQSWWLGGLATSNKGDQFIDEEGKPITKCKSDVLLRIWHGDSFSNFGVSVKTCSKATPTNDQLYFTTASAFSNLLRNNGLKVSKSAEEALKMFCGDSGYRPSDNAEMVKGRKSDPDRWFWEELPQKGRREWERLFSKHQNEIGLILLQKAYLSDPYPPEFLLHQTTLAKNTHNCEVAIFSIPELVEHSSKFGGFHTKEYMVRKGRFKGDPNKHSAPRFGFVQMQRGGQKQHPTQLQFNLQAGYFNHIH